MNGIQAALQTFTNVIFKPIADNVLTKPEFFIAIIVLIGYALLRRPISECIAGFIKAAVGYMILQVGSNGLINNFRPILSALNDKFKMNAVVVDPYFGLSAASKAIESIGASLAFAMVTLLIAFLFNILLVALKKWTKVRVLFLTGHVMVQQATTTTWIIFLLFPILRNFTGALVVGLILGTYQSVSANLNVELCDEVTEGGGFALGHQQQFAVWITGKIAGKLGKKEKSVDDLKLPGWTSIFNDNVVATAVLMTIFFGILLLILGKDFMRKADTTFAATQAFGFYIVSKCFSFAVYFTILMRGVSMFIAELTESFRGISEKLIPGAIAGVDCPAIFGYSSGNTVLWGFLWTGIGSFVTVILLVLFKSPVMAIPGFVPMFFDGGPISVFANKRGGAKAAAIICFCTGIVHIALGAVAASFFQLTSFGGWHGNFDFSTFWLLSGGIMKYVGIIAIPIIIIALLIIPQIQYMRNKEKYFTYAAKND